MNINMDVVNMTLFLAMVIVFLVVCIYTAGDAIMYYNEALEAEREEEYQRARQIQRQREVRREDSFRMYKLSEYEVFEKRA